MKKGFTSIAEKTLFFLHSSYLIFLQPSALLLFLLVVVSDECHSYHRCRKEAATQKESEKPRKCFGYPFIHPYVKSSLKNVSTCRTVKVKKKWIEMEIFLLLLLYVNNKGQEISEREYFFLASWHFDGREKKRKIYKFTFFCLILILIK